MILTALTCVATGLAESVTSFRGLNRSKGAGSFAMRHRRSREVNMSGTIGAAIAMAITVASVLSPACRAEMHACPCTADTYLQLSEGIPWSASRVGHACEGLYPGSNRNVITDGDRRHSQDGDLRDALFAFDLTGVAGAISSATLRLTCTLEGATGNVATVTVHPMYVEWSELGADWTMRTETKPWLGGGVERGGNYDPVPAATHVNTLDDNWVGKHIEFDVTALVDRWIHGGLTNHGLLVMSASEGRQSKRLDWCSRDGNPWRSNNWPQLIVHVIPPAGGALP